MKFKKLVAALSAVTMLGSLAVAVPASAEEEAEASVTLAAQVRGDGGWSKMNNSSNGIKGTVNDEIEVNAGSYMVAYYKLYIPVAAGKKIDKVTIDFTKTNNVADYNRIIKIANPEKDDISSIWNIVSNTFNTEFSNGSGVTLEHDNDWTETDITSLELSRGTNSIVVYSSRENNSTKYSVSNPILKVTYVDDPAAEGKAAQNMRTGEYFDSLQAALEDNSVTGHDGHVATGDTITLLKDAEVSSDENRILVTTNKTETNLTIDGNGKAINITKTNNNVFEIGSGRTLYLKNANITGVVDVKQGGTLHMSDSQIIGTLDAFGKVFLEKTSVNNIYIDKLSKASTISANSESYIGTVNIDAIEKDLELPYEVFTGDLKPEQVNVPDGYIYTDGKIDKAMEGTQTLNYAFEKKISELGDTVKVSVNTNLGSAQSSFNKGTQLSGSGDVMLGIILQVPSDITVNSVTIE